MSDCTHDCSSCKENCSSREIPKEKLNELSKVGKVYGIVSGKGGVGKSLVTAMLATLSRRKGSKVAVLDADITGPSIPKMFGLKDKASSLDGQHLLPVKTKTGIEVMSINLLLENEEDPVVWRGPVIAGVVKQFWTDVVWDDVDYMFVDMPPGTGDVPLTVYQSLPIDGVIVVMSPQDLVGMIVEKAVKMAKMMGVPIVAFVENMSYVSCPDCGKKIEIYGKSKVKEIAEKYGVDLFARLPVSADFARQADRGLIELFEGDYLSAVSDAIDPDKK